VDDFGHVVILTGRVRPAPSLQIIPQQQEPSMAKNLKQEPLSAREQLKKEADARRELSAEADRVMAESRPTPTQEENDLAKLGALHPDDKEDPDNPEMPEVWEQQARIAEAGSGASYQTRDAAASRPAASAAKAGPAKSA
jgi:hypothetical protein